jgi:4-hydroxy-tetrahydrodipicolinate synthase
MQLVASFRHRDDFTILLGTELLAHIGLMIGADGIVGGLHNIAPKIAVALYKAIEAHDHMVVSDLVGRLTKLWRIFEYGEIWGGFEAALQILGICEKATASPYSSLGPNEKAKVEAIMRECLF